jgi:hypothetical protein
MIGRRRLVAVKGEVDGRRWVERGRQRHRVARRRIRRLLVHLLLRRTLLLLLVVQRRLTLLGRSFRGVDVGLVSDLEGPSVELVSVVLLDPSSGILLRGEQDMSDPPAAPVRAELDVGADDIASRTEQVLEVLPLDVVWELESEPTAGQMSVKAETTRCKDASW